MMSVLDPTISIAIPALPVFAIAIVNEKILIQSPSYACFDTLVWVNDVSNISTRVKSKLLCRDTIAADEVDRIAVVHFIVLDVKAHVRISHASDHSI